MIFQCNLTFQGCKRKSFDQHSSQTAVKLSGMVSILPLQVPTGNFTGTMVIGGMAGRVMGSSSKSKEDDSRARETSNKNEAKLYPEKRSQDIYCNCRFLICLRYIVVFVDVTSFAMFDFGYNMS